MRVRRHNAARTSMYVSAYTRCVRTHVPQVFEDTYIVGWEAVAALLVRARARTHTHTPAVVAAIRKMTNTHIHSHTYTHTHTHTRLQSWQRSGRCVSSLLILYSCVLPVHILHFSRVRREARFHFISPFTSHFFKLAIESQMEQGNVLLYIPYF